MLKMLRNNEVYWVQIIRGDGSCGAWCLAKCVDADTRSFDLIYAPSESDRKELASYQGKMAIEPVQRPHLTTL